MQSIPFLQTQQAFQQQGAAYFLQAQREYGDLAYAQAPLLPYIYYLFHPDQYYEVLMKQSAVVDKPNLIRSVLRSSFGNGLFTSAGDFWRRQRKLMQPTFHHARIGRFAERMVGHATRMLDDWQDSQTRILDREMHLLTFTIVVDALFSEDATGTSHTIADAMHDLGEGIAAQGNSILLALMPDWAPIPIIQRKQRGVKTINRIIYQMLEERRSLGEEKSPQDLLSMLLFARDEDTGEQMDSGQIRDELMTLFIAGHETTAVLLGWVWAMLAQNPQVEAALHQELKSVLGDRLPTLEDAPRLKLTESIIKETLRLYPPAWFMFRENSVPLQLGNETLRKGSILFLFPYVTQRDPRWFDDPESFKPERWNSDLERTLPKGAFMPFGMGPRVCIGNGFAMLEAQLLTATIAQRFRIELLDQPKIFKGPTTLAFENPVRVRLHRR